VHFPDNTIAVAYNDWEPGYAYEASNTAVDPQYNNPAAGDLRLKTTSPCKGKGLRPGITAGGALVSSSSILGVAYVRSPWMTAAYRMQARLCDVGVLVTSTAPCTGTWITGTTASTIGTDIKVTAGLSGLLSSRVYETRWVTWQALQPAPSATYAGFTTYYWMPSAAKKVQTAA
jgi:hypothetical protein